jgi:hypothetical protein
MDHAIVAGNTRGSLAGPDDVTGNVTLSNSLLGVGAGAAITEVARNLIGTLESPIDPLLGPLADNGGFELPDGSGVRRSIRGTSMRWPGQGACRSLISAGSHLEGLWVGGLISGRLSIRRRPISICSSTRSSMSRSATIRAGT